MIEGRFVDPAKIVCPHGGAYAFDPARDACTCSLHNRLKYLTPNVELNVLNVSQNESAEYDRYKQRYQAFWQGMFDPIAVRITVDRRVKLETCVLPMANGSLYNELRAMVDKTPRPLGTARIAPSAIGLAGDGARPQGDRRRSSASVPGVAEVLAANPTLDRPGLAGRPRQPALLRRGLDPAGRSGPAASAATALAGQCLDRAAGRWPAALLMALKMPVYATIDVENRDQAAKLLEQLSQRGRSCKGPTWAASRSRPTPIACPTTRSHPLYVFGVELYAVKLRLHVAVVGDQLVVATKPELLREVIDASTAAEGQPPARRPLARAAQSPRAEPGLRRRAALLGREGPHGLQPQHQFDLQPASSSTASRSSDVPRLSEAKYGVQYFCPDDGDYRFDAERNQVVCSVHGNREQSRQNPHPDRKASFARFIENIDEVTASLRFQDDALMTTVEIVRSAKGKP